MGALTRKEMEDVINAGGSIVYKELVLSTLAQLPSEADLAVGNPEQEAAVAKALDDQIASLTQARARLDLARQPVVPTVTAEPNPPLDPQAGTSDPQAEKAAKKHAADSGRG